MHAIYRSLVAGVLAAALLATAAASATENNPPTPATPSGMLSFHLSNGIQLLAQPRYELEFAHVSVFFPAPAGLGPQGASAARWLEALYLDTAAGEEDTPRQALATLDAVPSVSFTGRHMVFQLLCLPDGMPRALASLMDVVATDRFREPHLSQAATLLQGRDRLAHARGWTEVRPEVETALLLGASLEQALEAASDPAPATELLVRCHARMMDPSGIRIVISGRGDVASAARLLLERTRGWKKSTVPPAPPLAATSPAGGGFAEWGVPANPPAVVVCLTGPGRASPRLAPFLVACSLLADGATSLAGRLFRQGEAWVPAQLETRFQLHRDRSLFLIEMQAPAEAFDETERRLFTAAELIAQGQWQQVDLERARHQAFVHLAESVRPTEIHHTLILETERAFTPAFFRGWRQALGATGKKDVTAAARAHLVFPQAAVLELPGAGVQRGFTARSFREAMAAVVPLSVRETIALFQKTPDIPLALPAEDPEPAVSPEGMNAVVPSGILRGPEVLVQENHRWPLVWMCVTYPGGTLIEPPGQRGLNRLALRTRLLGVRDAQERLLLERLEMLGARLRLVEGTEFSGIEVVFPAYFRRAATETLFRILHRQDPAAEDVTRCLAYARLFGKSASRMPAREAESAALAAFYGAGSAFARQAGELESPTAEAVTRHYAERFHRTLPLIAMAGQFQGTELLPVMTDFVAGSAFSAAKLPLPQPEFPVGALPEKAEAAGPVVVSMLLPGPYGGESDVLQLEALRWLYLASVSDVPPARGQMRIVPLLSRGYLQFEYVASGDWARPAAELRGWLKGQLEQSINIWRLTTALKLTELEYRARMADPPSLTRWLVLNALWKSRLWDDKTRRELLVATNKEKVRELLTRFLTGDRFAIAAAPLPDPSR